MVWGAVKETPLANFFSTYQCGTVLLCRFDTRDQKRHTNVRAQLIASAGHVLMVNMMNLVVSMDALANGSWSDINRGRCGQDGKGCVRGWYIIVENSSGFG